MLTLLIIKLQRDTILPLSDYQKFLKKLIISSDGRENKLFSIDIMHQHSSENEWVVGINTEDSKS